MKNTLLCVTLAPVKQVYTQWWHDSTFEKSYHQLAVDLVYTGQFSGLYMEENSKDVTFLYMASILFLIYELPVWWSLVLG